MEGRYTKIPITKDDTGKRRMLTVMYPSIPYNTKDIYVRTTVGDRLDLLAYQYYGNVKYWWIIAHANNLGKGSMVIPEGSAVRIPTNAADVQMAFEQLNKQ